MVAVVHVMALASAIMVLVWCIYFRGGLSFSSSDKSLIFNLHPVFMLGFVITGGEATIVYRSLASKRKQVRKLVDAILHILALVEWHVRIGASIFVFRRRWRVELGGFVRQLNRLNGAVVWCIRGYNRHSKAATASLSIAGG